jgi:hypothetical protein
VNKLKFEIGAKTETQKFIDQKREHFAQNIFLNKTVQTRSIPDLIIF